MRCARGAPCAAQQVPPYRVSAFLHTLRRTNARETTLKKRCAWLACDWAPGRGAASQFFWFPAVQPAKRGAQRLVLQIVHRGTFAPNPITMASPVKEPAPRPKIFNDPIHGHIELHPLCVKVIDTPQFQRLKDLKQVGGVYSVFPGAAHNRFEHCIGTAFMATTMVEHLCTKQPKLFITEQEVLCVALAGLCHDLGHGILSHAFDLIFIPRMNPDTKWQHEHASVAMLDHLIQSNDLMPVFERYGLDWDHVHFIQELILGDESDAPPGFEWRGRPGKQFLYEIVANKVRPRTHLARPPSPRHTCLPASATASMWTSSTTLHATATTWA